MPKHIDWDLDHEQRTGYLDTNDSYKFDFIKVTNKGLVSNPCGSGYTFKILVEFDWGTSANYYIYEGTYLGWGIYTGESEQRNTWCWGDVVSYEGQYMDSTHYTYQLFLDGYSAAHFSGADMIEILIGWQVTGVDDYFLDKFNGNDNNYGWNWDEAWETLDYAANNTPQGKDLHIQIGDYRVSPDTSTQIAPVNAGSGVYRIKYILEDKYDIVNNTDWTDGFTLLAGSKANCFWDTFEQTLWGEVIRYFYNDSYSYINGYSGTRCSFVSSDVYMGPGELTSRLIDDNTETTIYTGSSINIEEGYEIQPREISLDGTQVTIDVTLNGTVENTYILSEGETLVHKKTVGGKSDFPVIAAYIQTVFRGTETNMVIFEGLWQVSDTSYSTSVDTSKCKA